MSQISFGTITIVDTTDIQRFYVEYAKSNSSAAAPTTGWSQNRPTWQNGTYIWQRTVMKKQDVAQLEYGNPVCITGEKGQTGQQGIQGNTGKGIFSIVTTYCNYGTGTPAANYSGWNSSVPEYDKNKPNYWVKTTVNYTSGNPSVTIYKDLGITEAAEKANFAASVAQTAESNSLEAISIAGSKNKIYYSTSFPTEGSYIDGDTLFYKTSNGTIMYVYDSSYNNNTSGHWRQQQFEENAISDLAITNAKIKNLNGDKIIANTIAADKIVSHSITAVQLATNAIKSSNYNAGTAPYSLTGTFLDLSNGNIFTPNFGVNNDSTDNIDNGAYIKGTIQAYDGKIGSDTNNYWYIGNYFDYNQGQSAMIRSHGTAAIQLGDSTTWRLSTNRIHTAWNDDSTSGQAFRLHYPSYGGKYWDSGLHVPTSATDKLLYIRNAPTSTSLENLQNDIDDNSGGNFWNYQFYLTNDGSLYAKNIYIMDESGNTTQIGGTDGVYLLKSGGTIENDLVVNKTLKVLGNYLNKNGNAITLQTNLNSTTAGTLTGNTTSAISIGITGTLPTSHGGTGNTSYTTGGVVYVDGSNPKKLLSTAAGTSGYLLKSGGTGAPTWVDPGTLTVAAAAKDGDGNIIKTTYLKLTGGNVTGPVSFGDSVSIDDLNAGSLVVTGNASFTNNINANTINGVTVGSSPKFTDTTYAFDNGYSASNNKGATVLTVTNAIGALNVNPINGATNKTLTSISEIAGKISATYSNISITKSQVSDFPTSMPASDVSAWAKASTKPTYKQDEILPLQSKTFTGVIGTENNWANATFFFGSIKPATWEEIWRIKYRIKVFVPGQPNYNQMADVMISGRAGDLKAYASLNTIGAYYVCYYHELYRMKEAGFNNGYGHSLGVRFYSAYSPTDTNYKRTIDVEILETENCTFSFYNSCLTYANIPGTGSTNYNTYSEMDFVNNGLQETGDSNDVNYYNRTYYTSRTTSAALYRYQFCLTKSDGTLVPVNSVNNSVATNKTLTIDSFDPFGEIFYWNTTSTASANANVGNGALYRQYLCDLRYSFNCGGYDTTPTLTARMPLYLVATPQADGTAKLYIEPLSMYLPSSEDGLIYIYLGRVYEDTKPYRVVLSLNHPIYEYRNGAVRLYTGLKSETAASGGTNVSLVTTGQKYLWNSKTNNIGTVTSVAASGSGGITIGGSPITTSGTLAIGLNLSTAINGLGEGTSAANRDDYAVVQYAGGGTTTTSYHRRKLSNVFKALIADDIPNLAWSKITSGNDDLKAIEALTGTSGFLKKTAANTWTLDTNSYVPTSRTINGHALSGNISISKTDVGLGTVANALQIIDIGSNDAGQLVLTYGDNTTATRAVSITATTSSSVAKAEALNTGGKKVGDSNKPVYFGTDGKPVAISYTIEKSVPADAIFPKFEGTYNESTNKAATVSTVTNAINALDGNLNSTTPGAGKTLTAFSQTNGKISATFGDISITKSQISDFPISLTPTSHTHGNISNTGTITSTAVALGNGDNLLFADSSNGGKVERSSITIGTGTSKYLRQDGTWGTPAGTYSLPVATDSVRGGVKIGYTTSGKNYAVQLSSQKMYVNVPWTDTTYSAGTGLSLSGTTFSNSGVRSISTGTTNGTISVNTNGTSSNIAVKGLGSAAFVNTSSFPIVSTYTLSAAKAVRIQYPTQRPVLISAQRSNGGGRLILLGGGYGPGGTIRNDFQELVSSSIGIFTWTIPSSDSISNSIEIMNVQTSGTADITVWSSSAVTFTEIDALSDEAMNRNIITSMNYTDYTVTKIGTGASGTWGIDITGKVNNINFKAVSDSLATGGWKKLNGLNNHPTIAISFNTSQAVWNSSTYSSTLVFGASDTRGMLDIAYNSPIITFGGTNYAQATEDRPKWYFKLSGTSDKTYILPSDSKTLAATDGSNATGSWSISITGNAATATKATQDGSGGIITDTYLKKAGDSTTGGLAINASNSYSSYNEGLRINAGARTYATLLLGGTNNSTSGTNDGAFWLGVYNTSSYSRRLMIAHNGSTATNTYFYSSSASQVSPALHLGTSGTITSGNADAITGGTVYTALTQGYVTLATEQTITGRKTFENLAAVTFKPSSGTDNCSINYDATLGALVFSF